MDRDGCSQGSWKEYSGLERAMLVAQAVSLIQSDATEYRWGVLSALQ